MPSVGGLLVNSKSLWDFLPTTTRMMIHASAAAAAARRAAMAVPRARPTMQVRMLSRSMRVCEGTTTPSSPKITEIVDSIEKLTLLEASELVQELKVGSARTGMKD